MPNNFSVGPPGRRSPSITGVTRTHSSVSVWCRSFNEFLQRGVWMQAVKVQRVVMRNTIGSIAFAWAGNALFYLGNPFSSKSSHDQSTEELIVSNVVWCGILYAINIVLGQVPTMRSQHFIAQGGRRPSGLYCLNRIVRESSACIFATLLLMFGMGVLMARISRNKLVSKFSPEYYGIILCNQLTNTSVVRTTRRFYFQETREGRDRLARRLQKKTSSVVAATNTRVAPSPCDVTPRYVEPSFCRAYVKFAPFCVPIVLAGGYVQLLSQLRISEKSSIIVAFFMIVNVLTKLILQESAKYLVMKKRIRSIRVMSLVVGVPTVIIDTQARIILLGINSTGISAVGTFGMAVLEISVRVAKTVLITWKVNRRQKLQRSVMLPSQQSRTSARQSNAYKTTSTRKTSRLESFLLWRQQSEAFHTAELNADMHAEYIAIGCSASILFFYGNHPHYSYLSLANEAMSAAELAARQASQVNMLFLQIGVEVIVDYASIVLEIVAGVDFEQIKGVDSFLAAVFGTIGLNNIIISAMLYLD